MSKTAARNIDLRWAAYYVPMKYGDDVFNPTYVPLLS